MNPASARLAHDVGSRALAWLHAHREYGTLDRLIDSYLGEDADAYKALGETALAASLVLRGGLAGAADLERARDLLDFGWAQLGEGSLLYERLLRHPLHTDPLELYLPFARAGYRYPPLDRLLAHTRTLPSVHAVEMLPNRRLAIANALRVTGFDDGGRTTDWAALARATWLGNTPEPWNIDWITGYTVTHTVFHLTDWGALPDGLPKNLAGYVANWLPVWTNVWAEIGQWDLMVELMIVGACLPEPQITTDAWERLAGLQHDDGLVPRDGEPVEEDPARRFHAHQHPTVVAAVAGTLALMRTLDTPRPA